MNNILIACDTTSAMSFEDAKTHGIELIPLSVLINGIEFKDQLDISNEVLYDELRKGLVPTTSQPNTGYLLEVMQKWKDASYDAILILACSSDLSGTWQGYHLAKNQLEMDNVIIVDTRSVAAPIMDAAICARQMANNDASIKDILDMLDLKFQNTFSFLYPKDLVQLKKGGRISPLAANMASLLKMKPLLYLREDGKVVEKFGMARTEGKILQLGIDKFRELKIDSFTHKVYILHADNEVLAEKVVKVLQAMFDDVECEIVPLPSVLTCHGGLGCIAVQTTIKYKGEH